jgi:plastocyanin
MKKLSILLAAIALAAFGLVACGDDEESDDETTAAETTEAAPTETEAAGDEGATIDLSSPADGSFAYDQTELTAPAGPVTINYDNPAPLSHDVVVEDEQGTEIGKTNLVSGGDTSTTVDLEAGTYTYFCDVPGHREGGMEGTLTVK